MTSLPAEQWPQTSHDAEGLDELDRLIDAVSYYEELAFEYPTTPEYRHLLESARNKLKEAEAHCPNHGHSTKV